MANSIAGEEGGLTLYDLVDGGAVLGDVEVAELIDAL